MMRRSTLALGLALALGACGSPATRAIDVADASGALDTGSAAADTAGPADVAASADVADTGSASVDTREADAVSAADDAATPGPDGVADAGSGDVLSDAVVDDAGSDALGSLAVGRHEVLFVGNSYTYVGDVPGLYRGLVAADAPDARVESVAIAAYRLVQHAEDARTEGTPLARWLRTGTAEETAFDAVVLQEQSQIGGFPEDEPMRVASVAAASELAALATAHGAAVVLYQTWGREHGDPANAGIGYATFLDMEARLEAGYAGLADALAEQGVIVRVAPVGAAFRLVYEDVVAAGGDPEAAGSEFDALYASDGSHPSPRGAYLAACVIAGTVTGADVGAYTDPPNLAAAESQALRDACARALIAP